MAVMVAFLALVASFLVGYTRSRGEGIGIDVKVGVGTRVERFIIMAVALLFSGFYENLLLIALILIVILAGITVLQRMWVVYKVTHETPSEESGADDVG
jgi:CDP-diacylglycerol--glycerol-3-phosphate 3-phosphatidyltransferase